MKILLIGIYVAGMIASAVYFNRGASVQSASGVAPILLAEGKDPG